MTGTANSAPTDRRTPRKRVRHLGASGHGVEHFVAQRASALALLILAPSFLIPFALAAREGAGPLAAFLGSPLGALLGLAFFTLAALHLRIGIAVIAEDYIARPATRWALVLLATAFAVLVWAVASFSILVLALGS